MEVKQLPDVIKTYLNDQQKIRFVSNTKLRKAVFQGTLDEMKPMLEEEVKRSKAAALFLSDDAKRFILVVPRKSAEWMELGYVEVISTDFNFKPLS